MMIPTSTRQLLNTAARNYFTSGAIASLGALLYLLLIPADPKNAWILGFSKSRLLMALVMFAIVLVFSWLAARTWRGSRLADWMVLRLYDAVDLYGGYLPGIILAYGVVLGGGILAFWGYLHNQHLTTREGVLLRLSPFVILGLFLALQLSVTLWLVIRKLPGPYQGSAEIPTLQINPQKTTFILASIGLLLVLISVMVDFMEIYTWNLPMLGFRVKLDIDREANIPTFFATVLLLLATTLLRVIESYKRAQREPYRYHWSLLTLVFLLFAVDEASVIHERIGQLIEPFFQSQGIFHYPWVGLGIIFVLLLGITYLRFILHLPPRHKKMFIAALSMFFLGAIGIEMATGWYIDTLRRVRAVETMLKAVEEILEMGGVILFIRFLLNYIKDINPKVIFSIVDQSCGAE